MNPIKKVARGDIVNVDFAPVMGREMDFQRPAIVISPVSFNLAGDLIIVCPITSTETKSPWEVALPHGMKTTGFVRVDHIKSIDKNRCEKINHRVAIKETAPKEVLEEIQAKLELLIL